MTPERFQHVRHLFETAAQQPPDTRVEWLTEACHGDADLIVAVADLLRADQLAEEGLTFTPSLTSALCESIWPSLDGQRIGQYQILREIGHGGMGAVYLARRADNVFSKQVALKIVRPERHDPDLLRHFHREREIIAALDHPNIARLLDGGTTADGLPYSVMEFVDGQPIDRYCDAHQLPIADRLRLVEAACLAVQYAHQHLVVHLDLKPSNILVTRDGVVKLLDFGIAKLLDGDTTNTSVAATTGSRSFTLAYASPEQVTGDRISTSSDVYSLGVVLYELVTGRRPYVVDNRPVHHVTAAICEQEPPRPSSVVTRPADDTVRSRTAAVSSPDDVSALRRETPARLAKRLKGELDNIILVALRKEPARRYALLEHFHDDIARHLAGLPVTAQPTSGLYRTRKFVARHRVRVAAAAIVVLSMAAAVAVTSWQAAVAGSERRRAEQQAGEARVQSQRAEQQKREAERYRQRAEHEAQVAGKQLRVADTLRREADARREEAQAERRKAERRAADLRGMIAAMLDVNATIPELPAGIEAGKRAIGVAERSLSALQADGFRDVALGADVAAIRQAAQALDAFDADIVHACPAAWELTTEQPEEYECGLDRKNALTGAAAFIRSRRGRTGYAELRQYVESGPYLGRRVRISGMLKTAAVEGTAGLVLHVMEAPHRPFIHYRWELPLRGTNDWSQYAIVADVRNPRATIVIGIALNGSGTIWADDLAFEEVDNSVPVTNIFPKGPVLDEVDAK